MRFQHQGILNRAEGSASCQWRFQFSVFALVVHKFENSPPLIAATQADPKKIPDRRPRTGRTMHCIWCIHSLPPSHSHRCRVPIPLSHPTCPTRWTRALPERGYCKTSALNGGMLGHIILLCQHLVFQRPPPRFDTRGSRGPKPQPSRRPPPPPKMEEAPRGPPSRPAERAKVPGPRPPAYRHARELQDGALERAGRIESKL